MACAPLSLWYKQPAPEWVHGIPVGNGRLGAIVLGEFRDEVWHLNEDSVWYAGNTDRNPPDALKNLPKLRQLLEDGQVSQILRCDQELTFMLYLFGIYLLRGSFILLLFVDRIPQLGLNESVEEALRNDH